ncbi:MAG: hypothetical protein JRN33_04520 [Nitrososphaerota archaeon]|jgi:hypothetical protein|nr:hypothetical protein [Nitrososphaerota archaeon]MDG6954229.1 hypothetical protein [Nitrososphaerota archaeon]
MEKHDEKEHDILVGKKTVLVKCIDCKLVMGTEKGLTPEVEVQWSLCTKCISRRNGVVGARTPLELGIR